MYTPLGMRPRALPIVASMFSPADWDIIVGMNRRTTITAGDDLFQTGAK